MGVSNSTETLRGLARAFVNVQSVLPWQRSRHVIRGLGDLAAFPNVYILGCLPNLESLAKTRPDVEWLEGSEPGFPILLEATRVRFLKPNSTTDEAYHQLLTRLHHMTENGLPRTLLVSSPNWNDGKSTTAANLALALARSGVPTCLVDANLRRPGMSQVFENPINEGLARHLEGISLPDPFERSTDYANLSVITAGKSDEDPANLFAGPRIGALLRRLSERHRIVIVDTGPVSTCVETTLLAPQVEEICLVARSCRTRLNDLEQAVRKLSNSGVRHVHAILNAH